jgi:hypothetical protein
VLKCDELRSLWSASREAWLFEDVEHGQWGLHLLSPLDSPSRTEAERTQRYDDFRYDDVVVGELLGDAELLVHAPSEERGRRYLIALPLDARQDLFSVGADLGEVLRRLLESDGDKFWERPSA